MCGGCGFRVCVLFGWVCVVVFGCLGLLLCCLCWFVVLWCLCLLSVGCWYVHLFCLVMLWCVLLSFSLCVVDCVRCFVVVVVLLLLWLWCGCFVLVGALRCVVVL